MLKPVRYGKKAPLECPDCGCRLNVVSFDDLIDENGGNLLFAHHFMGDEGRDAKSHVCRKVGTMWSLNSNRGTWELV